MVKLTQAEIASMIHRKEERRRDMLAELERRMQATQGKKKKKELEKGKKAVKNLMNTIFHHKDSKAKSEVNESGVGASFGLIRRKSGSNSMMTPSSYLPPMGMPLSRAPQRAQALSASSHNLGSSMNQPVVANGHGGGSRAFGSREQLVPRHHRQLSAGGTLPPPLQRRAIGHPNGAPGSASEFGGYAGGGRIRGGSVGIPAQFQQRPLHLHHHQQRYRRMQDSSFSSFSDAASSFSASAGGNAANAAAGNLMYRRPSVDTISTYLSHETSASRANAMAAARHLSYYGSLGSQELLDGNDDDSVFTNEDNILPGDSVSMVDSNGGGGGGHGRLEMPRPPPVRGASVFRDHPVSSMPPPRQRIMSDPSLSMAAAATRSLPSSPVKNNNPKHYPPSVSQSAYHHRRHLSHDFEDDDEASCSDLYVNQRDIQEAVRLRHRRRHR